MICIRNFIDFDEFKDFDFINKNNYTTIASSRKNISPFKKYLFKIFNFSCCSAKDQKIIMETFTQISNTKNQYLISYKKLSLSYKSKLLPLFSMKYISSETLEHALTSPEYLSSLKMKNILNCIFAVSEAMCYLHSHLINHGNLCPSNIIIDQVNQFYLCDFGLYPIKKLYIEEKSIFNKDYKDPYTLNKEPTYKSDVYSFGVLICQLFLVLFQVKRKSNEKQLTLQEFIQSQDSKKYQKFPKIFAELIPNCLNSDMKKRPSFLQIIDKFKTYKNDKNDIDISHLYEDFSKTNYLLKLSKTNESYILNKIGDFYDKEMHDIQKSMIYYKKASEFEYSDAQSNYGVSLQDTGWKNKPNIKEGARFLRESAKQGNIHGMFNYGLILLNGIGVEKNVAKAEKYLKKSADLGCKEAQSELGLHILGSNKVTPERIEEGLNYIKKAINQNYPEAMAQYAYLLLNGKNIERNYKLAIDYFKKAADLGHIESMIEFADGNMIGKEIPQNKEIALKYYKLAACNGHEIAKMRIEECMNNTNDVTEAPANEKTTKKPKSKINEINNTSSSISTINKTQENLNDKNKEKPDKKKRKKSVNKKKGVSINDKQDSLIVSDSQEMQTDKETNKSEIKVQDKSKNDKLEKDFNDKQEKLIFKNQNETIFDESDESIIAIHTESNLNSQYKMADVTQDKTKSNKEIITVDDKTKFNTPNKKRVKSFIEIENEQISKYSKETPKNKMHKKLTNKQSSSFEHNGPIIISKEPTTGKEMPCIQLPIQVSPQIKLISLGEIIFDEENYHTDKYIYPFGYQIEREYDSIANPTKKAVFRAKVKRGTNKPIFCVECLDESGMVFEGTTPSQPWIEAYTEVENSKKEHHMQYKNIVNVNGLHNFGFTLLNVSYLIERLDNANKCTNYINKKLYLKDFDDKIIGGHEVKFINYEQARNNFNEQEEQNDEKDYNIKSDENEEKYHYEYPQFKHDNETSISLQNESSQFNDINPSQTISFDYSTKELIELGDKTLEADPLNAFKYYKEAADRGESQACIKCANVCSSFEEKLKYFNLAIQCKNPMPYNEWRSTILKYSALMNDKEQLHKLAQLFEDNNNFSDAAYLYKRAKDHINFQICYEKAKENINDIKNGHQQYYFGNLAKKNNDLEIAKKMFERANKNKVNSAKEKLKEVEQLISENANKKKSEVDYFVEEGIRYYEGKNGTKVSTEIAFAMFNEASKLGCPKADFYIGNNQRNQTGALILKRSAEAGDPDGQNAYAFYLQNGIGVEKNFDKAMFFYKLAADQGHAQAAFRYGSELYNKSFTEEEKHTGISYIKKAAKKLFPDSLFLYSKIIADTNPDDSKKFYKIALEKGSNLAKEEYHSEFYKQSVFSMNQKK